MADTRLDLLIERPDGTVLDQVVVAVRKAIASGALAPGRRITERELIQLTGVSRTSIREAVRRLESLGLMEATTPRGVRVAMLGRRDVRHIYQVREALEPAVAALFAENATDQEIESLERHITPAGSPLEERLEAIWRFDETLRNGCGNPLMRGILEPLHARIHALRRLSALTLPGRKLASTQEYMDLAAALQARSQERAAAASRNHIRSAAEAALAAIELLESRGDDESI